MPISTRGTVMNWNYLWWIWTAACDAINWELSGCHCQWCHCQCSATAPIVHVAYDAFYFLIWTKQCLLFFLIWTEQCMWCLLFPNLNWANGCLLLLPTWDEWHMWCPYCLWCLTSIVIWAMPLPICCLWWFFQLAATCDAFFWLGIMPRWIGMELGWILINWDGFGIYFLTLSYLCGICDDDFLLNL